MEIEDVLEYKPTLRKMIIAVDGSDFSSTMEEYGAIVAKAFGSRVTVLHVLPEAFRNLELGRVARHNLPRAGKSEK